MREERGRQKRRSSFSRAAYHQRREEVPQDEADDLGHAAVAVPVERDHHLKSKQTGLDCELIVPDVGITTCGANCLPRTRAAGRSRTSSTLHERARADWSAISVSWQRADAPDMTKVEYAEHVSANSVPGPSALVRIDPYSITHCTIPKPRPPAADAPHKQDIISKRHRASAVACASDKLTGRRVQVCHRERDRIGGHDRKAALGAPASNQISWSR